MKESEIKVSVQVDENNVPEKLTWHASSANESSSCKAMILSLWDEKELNTLRVDLWTKDMTIDEMKQFFHQTLLTMTDTYERATNDKELTQDFRDFCAYFATKTGLIKA